MRKALIIVAILLIAIPSILFLQNHPTIDIHLFDTYYEIDSKTYVTISFIFLLFLFSFAFSAFYKFKNQSLNFLFVTSILLMGAIIFYLYKILISH